MTEPANESNVNATHSSISMVAQDITALPPHTSSFSSSSRKRSAPSESNDSESEGNNNDRTRTSSSEPEAIQPPPRSRPRIQRVSVETLYRQLESRFSNDNYYLDRLERAYTQPMSVVRVTIQGNNRRMFSVRGNTGTIYRVIIGRNMSCSCPDYVGHCKHLLMVLLKVFHMNANSEAYNTLKITTEIIRDIIDNYQRNADVMIGARELYDLEYESDEGEEQQICSICKEAMNEDDSSLPCQWCYTYVHEECSINPPWFYSRRRHRIKGFCEYCHASIENYDSQDSTGSDYYFSEEYQYNQRLDRANSQAMFIVRQTIVNETKQVFHVMGSTKNVYKVTIAKHISCDCPDFDKRHDHCKHTLMVLNKGFQVPDGSLACQQLNHSSEFIGRLLRTYNPIPNVIASQAIQDAFTRILRNGVDNRQTYINLDS